MTARDAIFHRILLEHFAGHAFALLMMRLGVGMLSDAQSGSIIKPSEQ